MTVVDISLEAQWISTFDYTLERNNNKEKSMKIAKCFIFNSNFLWMCLFIAYNLTSNEEEKSARLEWNLRLSEPCSFILFTFSSLAK